MPVTPPADVCPAPWLIADQVEVLKLLAGGMSPGQAAAALGKALGTVNLHLHCARRRTGLETTGDLLAEAARRGVV